MELFAIAAATVAFGSARADLPAGNVRCGQITCSKHQYCSEFYQRCAPCSEICDPSSNNYVQKTCEDFCQDYIHDERYVNVNAAVIQSLSRKVQNLTIIASVALVIAVILLVVLATLVVRKIRKHKHLLWRFTKRGASHASGKKVGAADDPESGNKAAEVAAAAAALQLPVSSAGTGAGGADESPPPPAPLSRSVSRDVATPATTSTPLSRPRHPSEDTTLDYAYDNPALAPSPSPGKEHTSALSTSNGMNGSMGVAITPPSTTVGFGGRKESSF